MEGGVEVRSENSRCENSALSALYVSDAVRRQSTHGNAHLDINTDTLSKPTTSLSVPHNGANDG